LLSGAPIEGLSAVFDLRDVDPLTTRPAPRGPQERRVFPDASTGGLFMTDDDDMGAEFDRLVDRMADPENSQSVQVVEVAETASIVEVTVPISVFPNPEVILFRTVASYLNSMEQRRAVAGFSVVYEVRSHNAPHIVATLFLSDPV
jgi:hypothetical protein